MATDRELCLQYTATCNFEPQACDVNKALLSVSRSVLATPERAHNTSDACDFESESSQQPLEVPGRLHFPFDYDTTSVWTKYEPSERPRWNFRAVSRRATERSSDRKIERASEQSYTLTLSLFLSEHSSYAMANSAWSSNLFWVRVGGETKAAS